MNLKNLSNENLLIETKTVVAREREILLDVLHHLKEIDARRLYLKIGFSSLWAYCTEELGYAEGSAQRRIEAMRAIRDLPVLEQKIESGVLSLSNVAKAQAAIRRQKRPQILEIDEKLEIFAQLENKSQCEAEKILAGEFPETVVNERVRRLNSEQSEIKLNASNELLGKLAKVRSLLSHKNPNPTQAELIEMMADMIIDLKDLSAKRSQPQRRQKCDSATEKQPKTSPPQGRYVAAPVKREVWRSALGKCEYTDQRTGRRCNSLHLLEIDHIRPKAFGGSSGRENLRLLCRAHNKAEARDATLMP